MHEAMAYANKCYKSVSAISRFPSCQAPASFVGSICWLNRATYFSTGFDDLCLYSTRSGDSNRDGTCVDYPIICTWLILSIDPNYLDRPQKGSNLIQPCPNSGEQHGRITFVGPYSTMKSGRMQHLKE